MNSAKNDTPISLLPLEPLREPIKLHIRDDDGPMVVKARRPVGNLARPYRLVCNGDPCAAIDAYRVIDDRDGSIVASYNFGSLATAERHMHELNDECRMENGGPGRDAPPPPNNPPFDEPLPARDDTDLDPNISASLDAIAAASAVCECDGEDEPCRAASKPRENLIAPGPWPEGALDRLSDDVAGAIEADRRERRSHLHTVDAANARERMTDQDRADLEAAFEAAWEAFADEADDLDGDFDDEDRDTLGRLYADIDRSRLIQSAVTLAGVFALGLAIGAILAHIF